MALSFQKILRKLLLIVLLILPAAVLLKWGEIKKASFDLMLWRLLDQTVPFVKVEEVELDEYTLLDTRERDEYEVSHIKGAYWVGFNDFDLQRVDNLSRDKPLLLYCSVGYRSEKIGERLREEGFTQVYNLQGGIFEWVNDGRPTVNIRGEETEYIHPYNSSWEFWLDKGVVTY